MEINDITGLILDRSVMIHRELGPGLLESVYQRILAYELRKAGLKVDKEVPIPVSWDGRIIDESFRADLIVESKVLVELKSIEKTAPVHRKQVITYLKLTGLPVGLLINFGAPLLKEDFHRIANDAPNLKP
ncbi:MAG: GxxExxY protein [Verrucomicrobiales bacterium]|nr:GxxExxY protein [Verrucomicrobiales bacterium]